MGEDPARPDRLVSLACGRLTLTDGTPCQRPVSTRGAPCGADHRPAGWSTPSGGSRPELTDLAVLCVAPADAPRLVDQPEAIEELVVATAGAIGLPVPFVEKDFWVTEAIRSLGRPITDDDSYVILKGGTSLLKIGITARMSEDVDALLVSNKGRGGTDKTLKALHERIAADLVIAEPKMTTSTTGIKRNVEYPYPRHHDHPRLKPHVFVELGTRGGPEPNTVHGFRSFVARHATETLGVIETDFSEFAPAWISVLSPARTAIEKLASLHDAASRPNSDQTDKLALGVRHLYDIWALLGDDATREELTAFPVAEVSADVDRHSEQNEWTYTPRPADGYAASPAFAGPAVTVLEQAWPALEPLVFGEIPSVAECIRRITDHGALL